MTSENGFLESHGIGLCFAHSRIFDNATGKYTHLQLILQTSPSSEDKPTFKLDTAKMSLLRTLPRKVTPLTPTRLFTTSPYVRKSATETAKETLESVNRTVGDAAVKGIEKGRTFFLISHYTPHNLSPTHPACSAY